MSKQKLRKRIVILLLTLFVFSGCKKNSRNNENEDLQNPDLGSNNPTVTQSVIERVAVEDTDEYGENLCAENEEVLFSFKLENSTKILSICISKTQPDYLVYRFGTKDKVELEFPEIKDESWSKFNYDYYLRGGGEANEGLDLNYLTFEHDGCEYQVYEEYSAEDDMTYVGIKIIEKATNEEIDMRGLSESVVGSLITLRGKM